MLRNVSVDAALAAWVEALAAADSPRLMAAERVPVARAAGRALAEPLVAAIDAPSSPIAAMDGIAVVAASIAGAPVRLERGAFARADTGQPVEPPFDAVAMIETVELEPDGRATVRQPVPAGANVRQRGEQHAAGEELLPAGRILGPYDLALAIAAGYAALRVRRRPRVAIVPTGDEVVAPGQPLGPGQVHDANAPMLAARLERAGGRPRVLEHVADDPVGLAAALHAACAAADVVLVIGGSSRGERDSTLEAIEAAGAVAVAGVAMRPGHPVLLGVVDATPVVGLPGYPAAAAVACELLVVPLLHARVGAPPPRPQTLEARLTGALRGHPTARCIVPVTLVEAADGALDATPLSRRGSALRSLATADGYVDLPAGEDPPVGTQVEVVLFA